jgi:hypothetical protein
MLRRHWVGDKLVLEFEGAALLGRVAFFWTNKSPSIASVFLRLPQARTFIFRSSGLNQIVACTFLAKAINTFFKIRPLKGTAMK